MLPHETYLNAHCLQVTPSGFTWLHPYIDEPVVDEPELDEPDDPEPEELDDPDVYVVVEPVLYDPLDPLDPLDDPLDPDELDDDAVDSTHAVPLIAYPS